MMFDEVFVPYVTLSYLQTPHCAIFLIYTLFRPAGSKYPSKNFVPITINSRPFLFLKIGYVEKLLLLLLSYNFI
jgi:hypothetical protein